MSAISTRRPIAHRAVPSVPGYPPVAKHWAIGDRRSGALVGTDGPPQHCHRAGARRLTDDPRTHHRPASNLEPEVLRRRLDSTSAIYSTPETPPLWATE
jgi:hypothetical protein